MVQNFADKGAIAKIKTTKISMGTGGKNDDGSTKIKTTKISSEGKSARICTSENIPLYGMLMLYGWYEVLVHESMCVIPYYSTLLAYKFTIPRKFLFDLLEIVTQLTNPTNQVLLCGIHFLAQQRQDLTEGIILILRRFGNVLFLVLC